jgi:hypothetical protein
VILFGKTRPGRAFGRPVFGKYAHSRLEQSPLIEERFLQSGRESGTSLRDEKTVYDEINERKGRHGQ